METCEQSILYSTDGCGHALFLLDPEVLRSNQLPESAELPQAVSSDARRADERLKPYRELDRISYPRPKRKAAEQLYFDEDEFYNSDEECVCVEGCAGERDDSDVDVSDGDFSIDGDGPDLDDTL